MPTQQVKHYSMEDFRESGVDSVYRLVVLAARRASQINRTESRPLVVTHSKKPTMIALEEIEEGKVGFITGSEDEEVFLE